MALRVCVGRLNRGFQLKDSADLRRSCRARCCTQQSVHEYARHECRTPCGARCGVLMRPTACSAPIAPLPHRKRSPLLPQLWCMYTVNITQNKFYTIYLFNPPTILSRWLNIECLEKYTYRRKATIWLICAERIIWEAFYHSRHALDLGVTRLARPRG
jgi:hypothetical protein